MPEWWYLSFAGEEGFRGVAIVQGTDLLSAVAETNRLGINPHGEVVGFQLTETQAATYPLRNRLLQRTDLSPGHLSLRQWLKAAHPHKEDS